MTGQETSTANDTDELGARAAENLLGPNPFVGLRSEDLLKEFQTIVEASVRQPQSILARQAEFAREYMAILSGTSKLAPEQNDKRFREADWNDNWFYKTCLQAYLAWARGLDEFVSKLGFDEKDTQRARFAVSLATDALAPSNIPWTNPIALKRFVETGGMSALSGLRQNMLQDIFHNQGMPAQVDKTKFRVGGNLAASSGAVIFRNPVLELIQYRPMTESVLARPLIIVPPQINKFYLFDMAPGRSVIEYLVKNGFRVFAVSWRNPTPDQSHWNMDVYAGALLEAIDVARDIANSEDVNVVGACSGAMTI